MRPTSTPDETPTGNSVQCPSARLALRKPCQRDGQVPETAATVDL